VVVPRMKAMPTVEPEPVLPPSGGSPRQSKGRLVRSRFGETSPRVPGSSLTSRLVPVAPFSLDEVTELRRQLSEACRGEWVSWTGCV
jgi:hypothetical protein